MKDTTRVTTVPPITVEPRPPPSPPPPSNLPPLPPQASPLASFAAEMFVWLWFAPTSTKDELEPRDKEAGMRMQFAPTSRFIQFVHDVLTTTQVSHSVVLLALLFVSRLKQKNSISGSPGSEFRLAVTGLMLANKVLDDNTYTARTWSQVSSLELKPLVEGEAEFLKGLGWALHVTDREFRSFLKLLEGHVAARNARIGRGSSSRKIASTSRVRRQELEKLDTRIGGGGGIDTGLGITTTSQHLLDPSTQYRLEGGRNVRRRVGEGAGGATMSATSTPTMGTFSYPFTAPTSAPHPYVQSQPLSAGPSYQPSSSSISKPIPSPNEISPTASLSANRSSKKRNFDDPAGTKPFSFPSLPHLLLPLNPPPMSRSQSSSATFSATTPAYSSSAPPTAQPTSSPSPLPTPTHGAHVSFPRPPQLERVEQIHQSFDTLANRFSPRYDPGRLPHQRLSSLDYYSLAAGQGQGRLHQVPPPPLQLPPHGFPTSQYPVQYHPPPTVAPTTIRSGGGSLTSSPCMSHRHSTNYAPSKPSVLSGLRSSPPSNDNSSTSHRSSQQQPHGIPHVFSHHLPLEESHTSSRRPSKIASSPGLQTFDDGTSTPRPNTGGSTGTAGEYPLLNRLPPPPLSAGFAPTLHQHHYPPAQWTHVPPYPVPAPAMPWSAYANAGPPGVFWAAYPHYPPPA